MTKALVIGGSGLISTSVVEALIAAGHTVSVFNRGVTRPRWPQNCVQLIRGDRRDHDAFVAQLRDAGPWDCVIDMICSEPTDAEATRRACAGKTVQLIFCSTTNVYPKPATTYPVPESHPLGAAYKNGIDKAACEAIHQQAAALGDYALTIIRPGHTYGETGGILHSLGQAPFYLPRLRHGRPIIVHGDGQSLWSSLHADDVAAIFVAATANPVAHGQIYNACGLEWLTWDQYHQAIAATIGAPAPQLIHIPVDTLQQLAPDLAAQTVRSLQYPGIYDMTKAQNALDFSQTIPFATGIRRVVDWLDTHAPASGDAPDPTDRILNRWSQLTEAN